MKVIHFIGGESIPRVGVSVTEVSNALIHEQRFEVVFGVVDIASE